MRHHWGRTMNPKDSHVYRKPMGNKHPTLKGSHNGVSMIFYKHVIPSGSKNEFIVTTMIFESCLDQKSNPTYPFLRLDLFYITTIYHTKRSAKRADLLL